MDNPFNSPAVLSLCTGMRGLERGIERVLGSVRTIAYVEIEAFIIYNLVAQMEQGILDPAPVWANLKTFPAKNFYGKVHGITAGYPCQPFSHAGNRGGANDKRHLFPYILEIIKAIKPVWCFFENVPGHISMGYDEVYRNLRNLGYAVEAEIFSAVEIGAPHERERLFILAMDYSYLTTATYQIPAGRNSADGTSEYMGNTRYGKTWRKGIGFSGWQYSNQAQQQTGKGNRFEYSGDEISDTKFAGWQRRISARPDKERKNINGHAGCGSTVFPAPPGQQQYDWEKPRTIKPRLGCTVNGYNFREDLLRMYGNGVVEQTAEKALRTLIEKFL